MVKKYLPALIRLFTNIERAINQPIVGELLYYIAFWLFVTIMCRLLTRALL